MLALMVSGGGVSGWGMKNVGGIGAGGFLGFMI